MTENRDHRFPKQARLRKQAEFDFVYQQEHFAADNVLVIRACRNKTQTQHSRLGLSISKKVGNAVVRNRWKRLIREAFRLQRHELPSGLDFVVRPRKGAVPEHDAIFNSIRKLLLRLDRKIPENPVSEKSNEQDRSGSRPEQK